MTRELSDREAAFVELSRWREFWDLACSACGSKKCASVGMPALTLTASLLDEWGQDPALSVNEQDEEIILADPQYLPLILRGMESPSYLDSKKRVLLEALCVMLYDAINEDDEYTEEENKSRRAVAEKVRPELLKRTYLLLRPEQWIGSYVREVIFPYLGIQKTNKLDFSGWDAAAKP